jgi:uncharacterized protein YcbK (DUF882 family)
VWPKYLVLHEDLIDKLELVISDLERQGKPVRRMVVMSGFRTPLYNDRGVGAGGRAQDSRHQYGDAADVTIDANGDGRYTLADTRLVAKAVEVVEQTHPDLVGGMGLYTSRRYNTPYVHIDARGQRARWNG